MASTDAEVREKLLQEYESLIREVASDVPTDVVQGMIDRRRNLPLELLQKMVVCVRAQHMFKFPERYEV